MSPPSALYGGRADNTASAHTRTTSVLKRTYSNSSISSSEGGDHHKRPKASPSDLSACLSELVDPGADLTSLLPDAFDAVDQSLLTMESTTAIMRDQVGEYCEVRGHPGAQVQQHRLDKIAEEQQEQREMLQSIQQEYTLQIQSNGGGGGLGGIAPGVVENVPVPVIIPPAAAAAAANIPTVAVTTSVITSANSSAGGNSTGSAQFYRGADLSPS